MTLLVVSALGALGCVVRYLAEYAVRRHHPTLRPWATVAANAAGCLVAAWAVYRLGAPGDAHLRSVVVTGFCGGLTTFSSAFASRRSSSASTTGATRRPWWQSPRSPARPGCSPAWPWPPARP